MKLIYSFILIGLFLSCSLCQAAEGSWQGTGSFLNDSLIAPVSIDMTLSISLSESTFTIEDCWKNSALRMDHCNHSAYQVNDSGQIFDMGVKIGDIFPGYIIIFIGNDQVSEQMIFNFEQSDFEKSKSLRYQYSFTAYDGVSQSRRGELKKPN